MPRDLTREEMEPVPQALPAPHYRSQPECVEPIGRQRLRMLADFLDTVPAHRFDINAWTRHAVGDFTADCGSAACAVGWAGTIPSFKEAGFQCDFMGPTFDGKAHWLAVYAFFDINKDAAYRLFYKTAYQAPPSAAEVAANIRSYLAQHKDL